MIDFYNFIFNDKQWFTPNTYDFNYKYPEENSGVYLLTDTCIDIENKKISFDILYVGSSKNLKKRYNKHNIIRDIKDKYDYIQFYFMPIENYLEIEKVLIKKLKPKYNKHYIN